ncbi:hypothetical protein FOZ60_000285, partial [Perkinsus olseni]
KQDGLFSHIASYKSDLLVLDVDSDDYPVPAEDFIDANVTEFRTLQVEANVHPVLVRWSARLAEAVRARAAEEPDLSPAAIARWTFQELFYVGMVAGVDDSLAMSVAAFLSTSSTKQALRLARIVGLGSERALEREVTRQLSFVAVGPQLVLEAPRRGDHAQVASSVGTVGSGGPRYNVDKIPLEVTVPWDGPTAALPYVALRKNIETTGRFYKLGSDELLVFLFRNLSPALRSSLSAEIEGDITLASFWQAMDRRFGCTETSASATIRWEHLQMGEGDTVDAYASRVRMEAQLFARVTGTALTPSLIVARLVRGLRPDIRDNLEASLSFRLSTLTFEEAREAALYVEARRAAPVTERKGGGAGGGPPRSKVPSRPERTEPVATREGQVPDSGAAAEPKDKRSGKRHCRYCAEHKLPGFDKHNDDRCWQNPANAAIVPAWYKNKKGPRGENQSQDKGRSAGTFMATNKGAMWVRAESGGEHVGLLLDTGSDFSVVSRDTLSRLGVTDVSPLTSPVTVGSVNGAESVRLDSTASIPVTVKDTEGKVHNFNLLVHVADTTELNELLRCGVVLLGSSTMARLRGDILGSQGLFRSHVLSADFPLHGPDCGAIHRGDGGLGLVMQGGGCEVPSDEEIERRLEGWSWPTVRVKMSTTATPPPRRAPYPCGPVERRAMSLLVDKLTAAGHVEVLSERRVREGKYWVVPAFVVPKDSAPAISDPVQLTEENVQKQYRLVLDHRPVNECCAPLESTWAGYQVPISEGIDSVGAGAWFGSIDVKDAYFMLRYGPEDERYFGFSFWGADGSVRYGVHRSMVMGWCNASFWWSWAFWNLLDTALPEVAKFLLVYVDDVLVWHPVRETCSRILAAVLHAIRVVGGEVPPHKVKLPASEIDFVGLHLTPQGYTVSDSALAELRSVLAHPPTTLRGLRVKLGVAQYCRNLWNPAVSGVEGSLSHLTAPFTDMIGRMTAAGARKSAKLPWTPDHDLAWRRLAEGISGGLIGFHRSEDSTPYTQFVVTSDASPVAGAATLYLLDRRVFLESFGAGEVPMDSDWLSQKGLVVALWMHKWSRAERRYDISDRELYAICKALFAWRHRILECLYRSGGASDVHDYLSEDAGRRDVGRLVAMTDSTATLGRMLARNSYTLKPCTTRDKRWLSWLSDLGDFPEGGVTLCHVNGRHNQLSDVLSRLMEGGKEFLPEGHPKPVALVAPEDSTDGGGELARGGSVELVAPSGTADVDLEKVSEFVVESQSKDGSTLVFGAALMAWVEHFRAGAALPTSAAEALEMGLVEWNSGVTVFKEATVAGPSWALVVPDTPMEEYVGVLSLNYEPKWSVRQWLLFVFHDVALHPGAEAVRETMFPRFWWPGSSGDVSRWVQSCDQCLEVKRGTRLKSIPAVRVARGLVARDERGKHVALDHGFPSPTWMPASDPNHKAFVCAVCLSTGFSMLSPVRSTSTEHTMEFLLKSWVPLAGLPLSITADNAIASNEYRASLLAFGVRVCRVASFSPWANGAAERRVGLAKERMAFLRLPWDTALPWVQLQLNSTPGSSGASPALLMFGTELRTPSSVAAEMLLPTSDADGSEALSDSTDAPAMVRQIIDQVVGRVRRFTVSKHSKDALRRYSSTPGRVPNDGEKVVVIEPEGTTTPGKAVPVSAVHLESRKSLVDRTRPTLASEGSIDFRSLKEKDVVLCRLTDRLDALAEVVSDGVTDGLVHVLEPVDASGLTFKRVWIHLVDGDFRFADSCPAGCGSVLRSVEKVIAKVSLTAKGSLRQSSRRDLVAAGYLSE